MKTIAALLMMTSVAGAQLACSPGTKQPSCSEGTAVTGSQSYTLVLRDKRGITMLIRRQNEHTHEFDMLKACEDVADELKHSPDILDAVCFK